MRGEKVLSGRSIYRRKMTDDRGPVVANRRQREGLYFFASRRFPPFDTRVSASSSVAAILRSSGMRDPVDPEVVRKGVRRFRTVG